MKRIAEAKTIYINMYIFIPNLTDSVQEAQKVQGTKYIFHDAVLSWEQHGAVG